MAFYLVLAVLALLAAPPLWAVSRGRPRLRAGLDALSLTALAGLLLLTVLPHTVMEAGVAVLPALIAGLALPSWAEHRFAHVEGRLHGAILAFAALAMVVHAGADGMALSLAGHGDGVVDSLAASVVLHRLPTGLALWWLIRPAFGQRVAWGVLVALAAVTVLGAVWGTALPLLHSPVRAYFEAAMVGMLLHVMVHPIEDHAHHALPAPLADCWGARLGTLAGLGLVAALSLVHGPGEDDGALWWTAAMVAPVLLVACAVAVAVDLAERRHGGDRRVLSSLDRVAPWLLACLVMLSVLPVQDWRWLAALPAGPAVHWPALAVLLALMTVSLLHQGIRGFLHHLLPGGGHSHAHGSAAGDGHHHDHGRAPDDPDHPPHG
ncbi:hypothetical protein [Rhodothalassium salexigens]|uniref:hypothetical protein n=1 Tax=Rhodothalassium salexigens TaxID=1086 RepID=UPI0019131BCD|nr:hypothetical protein [Rhodothalassium salexigens]